ncbi:MAG: hypothetical protein RJB38_751 [Pseudomonadota bacterium]|jgi:hypothetical protein
MPPRKRVLDLRTPFQLLAKRQSRCLPALQGAKFAQLALAQQPFDRLLLNQSPLYGLSRERFIGQGGCFEPALLSSPRSLAGAILLENRIQYTPFEDELIWTATDRSEPDCRLEDLRTYTTSVFHEQNHRLLWRFLPPPERGQEFERRALNFCESLVVVTDMVLSDRLERKISHALYLSGAIYDPGAATFRSRSPHRKQALLATMYSTYLNLEGFSPKQIPVLCRMLFGSARSTQDAIERALRLDRRFVERTNPVWQQRNSLTIGRHFESQRKSVLSRKPKTTTSRPPCPAESPPQLLALPDDPIQHGPASFWAERWFQHMQLLENL